ncbi:otospiralin [Notolabrus celidotus]|uniref:otospiralin n=1 Tax=Notolabrus celidotus TaxID=1203425 RepID=UPI0014907F9A|nr:otospiralin [Notolabrus celidotus]
MRALCVCMLLCSLQLFILPSTAVDGSEAAGRRDEMGERAGRERRSLPYWGLWSSDFFGWLEELRAQAAQTGVEDLARTFWSHFPIATELGYDSPESDPQLEE